MMANHPFRENRAPIYFTRVLSGDARAGGSLFVSRIRDDFAKQ